MRSINIWPALAVAAVACADPRKGDSGSAGSAADSTAARAETLTAPGARAMPPDSMPIVSESVPPSGMPVTTGDTSGERMPTTKGAEPRRPADNRTQRPPAPPPNEADDSTSDTSGKRPVYRPPERRPRDVPPPILDVPRPPDTTRPPTGRP